MALLLLASLLTSCTGATGSPRDAHTPSVPSIGFRELWSVDAASIGLDLLDDRPHPMLAVVADVVVVTGADGATVGLDRMTGTVRWTAALLPVPEARLLDPPADLPDRAFPVDGYDRVIASASGIVLLTTFNWTVAIDAATGIVKWARVGFWRWARPTSLAMFVTGASRLNRVDPPSGRMQWSSSPRSHVLDVAVGTVVSLDGGFGDQAAEQPDGRRTMTAFDLDTGRTLWTRAGVAPAPVEDGLLIDGDRIVILSPDGGVTAFSTHDGAARWENTDSMVRSSDGIVEITDPRLLGAADGAVFLGVQAGGAAVVGVDAATGSARWRAALPWERKPIGTVGRAGVLASTPEYVVLLDPTDGHVRASRGDLVGAATMSGTTVCAPTASGGRRSITCLEPE